MSPTVIVQIRAVLHAHGMRDAIAMFRLAAPFYEPCAFISLVLGKRCRVRI